MSNIRKTTEQFIEDARKIHGNKYDYSLVNYVDIHTKVKILCKIHGLFEQLPNNHLKSNCPSCSNRKKKTTDSFIEECKLLHGDDYDYHKVNYINLKTKVIIICNTCGSEFEQTPNNHLCNEQGCGKCVGKNLTTEEYIIRAKKAHGDRYDYSSTVYIDSTTKIDVICKMHGKFTVIPHDHLDKNCFQCTCTPKKTNEDFIKDSIKIHGDKYKYDKTDYNTSHIAVIITCKTHGDFSTVPNLHLSQETGCPKCTTHGYSKKQINWLEYIMKTENIYIQHHQNQGEYRIPDTRHKVDGYCIKTNTIYQFHGNFFHGNLRLYNRDYLNPVIKKTMGELYDRTCVIEATIRNKGYNLIVIWEDEWDKISKNIKTNKSQKNVGMALNP